MATRKTRTSTISYPAQDVWLAVAVAYRINGGYIKNSHGANIDENGQVELRSSNAVLVQNFLVNPTEVLDQDREFADAFLTYAKGMIFKTLMGKIFNEYEEAIVSLINKDTITQRDLALASSIPLFYVRGSHNDQIECRIREAAGNLIPITKNRITRQAHVVKMVYSREWNTYYNTAITTNNEVVRFASKESLKHYIDSEQLITITGTAQLHYVTEGSTKLTRVKIS